MKGLLASTVTLVALSVAAASPLAGTTGIADYPPRAGSLQVSKSTVVRGGYVRATARGLRPASLVGFSLRRTGSARGYWLGQVRADRRGAVSKRLRVPARVPVGRWLLVANGRTPDGKPVRLRAVIRIR